MLASNLLSLLPLALCAMASPLAAQVPPPAAPAFPPASYLFTVNLTSGPPVELGQTPLGQRNFGPISGGTFAGPGLSGKVVGGVDFGLVDGDGHFNPDVVYLLQSSDGCTVLVRERGHAPNVFMLFETASKKLDYLNDVVAYGQASQVSGGLSVNVFKVGLYAPGP